MAQFRLTHFGHSTTETKLPDQDNYPREGLVNDVCKEWLMHEDQALAYRLQTEEYKHHLGHNRERNAILRKDTPKAREEQMKADEEAARTQTAIELALAKQELRDAALAAVIADDLEAQDRERTKQQEHIDNQLAKKLMEEEKLKVRQARELRHKRSKSSRANNSKLGSPSDNLSDLSDFCLKPSASMDEDDMRILQEDQDEELALLMQEQDLKRRGDLLQEDQLLAIEAQDKELAKILQEQEKAKAKKAREKARQKSLMKTQQQVQQEGVRPRTDLSKRYDDEDSIPEQSHYASIEPITAERIDRRTPTPPPFSRRPHSPQYATPIIRPQGQESSSSIGPNSLVLSHTMEHYSQREIRTPDHYSSRLEQQKPPDHYNSRYEPPRDRRLPLSPDRGATSRSSSSQFTNIACVIDPTYERRVKRGELSSPASMVSPSYHSSPASVEPIAGPSQHHRSSPMQQNVSPPSVFEDEDDYLPPPYMPIQGQRRTASLEKRKDKKDGCKQQ